MAEVMVVTGGSRGIGAAIARLAGRQGYKVCVNYNRAHKAADAVVEDIVAAGAEAIAVHADMSAEADVNRLFRTVDQELGPVTRLINNAGIVDTRTRVDEMTAERINRILALNVTGSFICAREAVRRMSTRHGGAGGVIVNISSIAADLGAPGVYVDYAASKAAIDTMTKGLALEVAEEKIRVNAVRPGLIDTEIHASLGIADRVETVRETVPVKRVGRPEEVADAVLWLCSDAASYVTGALIDVSGGR